jgi:hypothetical protein
MEARNTPIESESQDSDLTMRRMRRLTRLRNISKTMKDSKESDSEKKYRHERFYRWMGKKIKTDNSKATGEEFQYETYF